MAIIWPDIAMKQVGVAELKNNLSRHLRAVEGGEVIEVTDHDRPIARLVPIESKSRLVIRPAEMPFAAIKNKRYPPANWPISSLDLLLEDRRKR
jgi:prevent-host-death family protein